MPGWGICKWPFILQQVNGPSQKQPALGARFEQRPQLRWPLFSLPDPNPMVGSPGNLFSPFPGALENVDMFF